jgi:hypothetical protein
MRPLIFSSVLVGIFLSFCSPVAFGQATAKFDAFDPRHATADQQQISVAFSENVTGSTTIAQWSVKVNGTAVAIVSAGSTLPGTVSGNKILVKFDATAVNGVPYVLPGQTVTISFANTGSTVTTVVGGLPAVDFSDYASKNNSTFDCSDLIFYQKGAYGAVDVCSPVNMNFFQFQYRLSLRFRNSTKFNLAKFFFDFTWGDASTSTVTPYLSDQLGNANAAFYESTTYTGGTPAVILTARPTHTYPAANPTDCSFNLSLTPRETSSGTSTCSSIATTEIFATYDNDNSNSGTLSLPPSTTNGNKVCLGSPVNMQFTDATALNCRTAIEPTVPNNLARYIRIVYGSTNYVATGNIPDISVTPPASIGGSAVQITNNDATGSLLYPAGFYFTGAGGIGIPDFNGVIELATPVTAATALTYMAQITSTLVANQTAGQRFYVRLDYWDICNAYNIASPDANKVSVENYIEIVTQPDAPIAADSKVCNGTTPGSFAITTSGIPNGNTVTWYSNVTGASPAAVGTVGSVITTTTIASDASSAAIGTLFPGFSNATAGNYIVWASYNLTTGGVTCESEKVAMIRTVRENLSLSTSTIKIPASQCSGASVSFIMEKPIGTTSPPATQPVGGATEYVWTTPAGWTLTGGQGTSTVTYTANSSTTTSATWRYTTTPNCTSGSLASPTYSILTAPVVGAPTGTNSICQDATTSFTVSATGSGLTYQWQVDPATGTFANVPSAGGDPYSGEQTATLSINTTGTGTSLNNYKFKCIVTGSCAPSATSTSITLTVKAKPAITVQPLSGTAICLNGTKTYTVTATGEPTLTYQWEVDPNTGTFANVPTAGGDPYSNETTATLTVNTSGTGSALDNFKYRVIVNSSSCPASVTSNQVVLSLQGPSAAITNGATASICAGNDLNLTATENFVNGSFASRVWTGTFDENFGAAPALVTLTPAQVDALLTDGIGGSRRTALNPIFNSAGLGANKIGTYVLTLSTTDDNACSSTATITITVSQVSAQILYGYTSGTVTNNTRNAPVCSGLDVFLDGNPSGGSGVFNTHTWTKISGPGGATTFLSATNTRNPTFNSTLAGTYEYSYSVTDNKGCNFDTNPTVNITIVVNDLPTAINQNPAAICSDAGGGTTGTVNLTTLEGAINGGGGITYTWFEDYNAGTKAFTNAIATTYAIANANPVFARVLDGNGCVSPATVTYTVNSRPLNPTGATNTTSCSTDIGAATVSVSAPGGGLTIDWYDAASAGTLLLAGNNTLNPAAANEPAMGAVATYYAETRNTGTGCLSTGRTAVTLTSDAKPTDASVGANDVTCDDDGVLAGNIADNGGTGTWSVGIPIYYETFSSGENNQGIKGPNPHATTFTASSGLWSVTVPSNATFITANDWIKVDNGSLSVRNPLNTEVVWQSKVINISASGNVSISAQLTEIGTQAGTEYIKVFYKINGGAEVMFGDITDDLAVDGQIQTYNVASVAGNTLQIVMRAKNNAGTDRHLLDNVTVTSAGTGVPFIKDVNDPASTVSNLQVGVNTFTWTITSALGVCAPTTASMTITRDPQPVTADITQDLCETTSGSGQHDNYDLTVHNAAVAGGVATDRTVDWFFDASLTAAVPDATIVDIADGAVFYAKVTNDITSCDNSTPVLDAGSVTFDVHALPPAATPTVASRTFCDDVQGGVQSHAGVDLTSYNAQINATATITWFSSMANAVANTGQLAGATLSSASVFDGGSYTARVVDGLSCINYLEVFFIVNPLPATNSFTGNLIDCSSPSAVKVYQVNGSLNAFGTTHFYNWEVDGAGTNFQVFDGVSFVTTNHYTVTNTSFLILVRFPNSGSFTFTSSETIDNCTGANATLTAAISGAPPALSFASAPTEVCKGQTNVTYSLNGGAQLGSNYVWTVVGGTVVGPSSGNIGSITVNWGTSTLPQPSVSVTESNSSGCSGAPVSINISLHDNPVMSSPNNATICSGTSPSTQLTFAALLGGSAPVDPITFSWKAVNVPANVTGVALNDMGLGQLTNDLTNISGVPGVVTFEVTPVENDLPNPPNCTTSAQTVFITVLPEPVVTPGQTATICSGDAVNYKVVLTPAGLPATTKLQWGLPVMDDASTQGTASVAGGVLQSNAMHITDVLVNTSSASITATYTITPIDGTCAGEDEEVVITINPEPVGADITRDDQCSNQAFSVSPNNITNGLGATSTYTWTRNALPGGLTVVSAGTGSGNVAETLQNLTSGQLSAVYTVTPHSADGCEGETYEVTVPINPAPVGAATTRDAQCSSVPFSVSAGNITNGLGATSTFTWVRNPLLAGLTEIAAGSGSGNIAETIENLTSLTINATYTVTPKSADGCTGGTYVISVPINPQPVGTDVIRAQQCSGAGFSLSPDNITNGLSATSTFTWVRDPLLAGLTEIVAGTGSGMIAETLENLTGNPISAVYVVTPKTTDGCEGNTYKVNVPVNPEPVGADITRAAQCSNDAFSVSADNITNGLGGSSTFTWVRSSLPLGLTLVTPGSGVGAIAETIENLNSGQLSVTYTVTPTTAGCQGETYDITVPINPQPTAPALTTIERCSGEALNFNPQSLVTNGVISKFRYTVSVEAGPAASEVNAVGLDDPSADVDPINDTFTHLAVASTDDAIVRYTITPISNTENCAGNPFVVRVIIHPQPRADNVSETSCGQGSSPVVQSLQSQIANGVTSTFTYVVINDPTNPLAVIDNDRSSPSPTDINFTYINTTEDDATITYQVTPYSTIVSPLTGLPTLCHGQDFFYVITVSPQPVGANSLLDAICSNVPFSINPQDNVGPPIPAGANGVAISSYTWIANYDAGLTVNGSTAPASGSSLTPGGLITGTLTNKTSAQKFAEYTITPSAGSCTGPTFTIRLPIDPQPVIDPSVTPRTICSDTPLNIVFGPLAGTVTADSYDVTLLSQDPDLISNPSNAAIGLAMPANILELHSYTNKHRDNGLALSFNVKPNAAPTAAGTCIGDNLIVNIQILSEPVMNPLLANVAACSRADSQIELSTDGVAVNAKYYYINSIELNGTNIGGNNITVGNVTSQTGNATANPAIPRTDKLYLAGDAFLLKVDPLPVNDRTVVYNVTPRSAENLADPAGCAGDPFEINLLIRPQPVLLPGITPFPTVCSGDDIDLTLDRTATSVAIDRFKFVNVQWDSFLSKGPSNVNVGDILSGPTNLIEDSYMNTTNSVGEATYTIIPISADNCEGDPDATTSIDITPAPAVAAGLDEIVCNKAAGGIILHDTESTGGFGASSFKVTRPALPAGLVAVSYAVGTVTDDNEPSNVLALDKIENTTNDPIDLDYAVEAWTGNGATGCTSASIVTLTIEPQVKAELTELAAQICSETNAQISLESPSHVTSGTITYNFSVSGIGAPSGSNLTGDGDPLTAEIDQTLSNNTNIAKTATYKVKPLANSAGGGTGCRGEEFTKDIIVEPKPKLAIHPASLTVCEGVALAAEFTTQTNPSAGSASVFFTLGSVDLASGTLTRVDAAASPDYSTGVDALNEKLINSSDFQQTAEYTFKPSFNIVSGTCFGDDVTFNVTVSPRPVLLPFTISPQCSAQSFEKNYETSVTEADLSSTLTTWTYSYPAGATNMSGASNGAGTDLSQVVFNKNSDPVTVTYKFKAKSFNCESNIIEVPVDIYPIPKVTGVPSSKNICNNSALDVTLASTVNNSTYVWNVDDESQPDLSGASDQLAPVSNIPNFILTNSGESLSNYTFDITPLIINAGLPLQELPTGATINGCYGDPHTLVVNVAPPLEGFILTSNGSTENFICTGTREFLFMEFKGLPLFEVVYKEGDNTVTLTRQGAFKPLQVTPAVTTIYELVSIKDAFGCSLDVNKTATVNVSNTDAAFSIQGPEESCSPYKVSFAYDQQAGVNYTWKWFDGPDSTSYTADASVTGLVVKHTFENPSPTGTSKFKVYLETSLADPRYPGCSKTSFQEVKVSPNIGVGIFPNVTEICSGETVSMANSSQGVVTHKWFYRIPGTETETDVRTTSAVAYELVNNTVLNPIIYEIVYQADNGKCPVETIIPIKVYKGVDASFTAEVPDFVAGNATVTFTNTSSPIDENFFTYSWDFDLVADVTSTPDSFEGGDKTISVDYKKPGFFEVLLKAVNTQAIADGIECVSTSKQNIHINLPPLKSAFSITPLAACFPTTLVVNNESPGADTFVWKVISEKGEVASSNAAQPVFVINDPGNYTVTLIASLSSTEQTAAPAEVSGIEIYGKPSAFFIAPNPILFVPDTELGLINQSQEANFYEWNFDDGTISNDFEPQHFYKLEGKYTLTLVAGNDHGDKDIDGDGIKDGNVICYDTATTIISAKEGGFTRIPNAFTPDPSGANDGSIGNDFERNDIFLPVTKGVVEFNMQVYDRWGTLVFESNDKNIGWNGYDKNKNILPAGVYVYKLTLRLADGQRTTQVGDVTMIR